MSWVYWLSGGLSVALFFYLMYALFRAEKF